MAEPAVVTEAQVLAALREVRVPGLGGDLVSQRLGIVPLQCGATASALCRLDL